MDYTKYLCGLFCAMSMIRTRQAEFKMKLDSDEEDEEREVTAGIDRDQGQKS